MQNVFVINLIGLSMVDCPNVRLFRRRPINLENTILRELILNQLKGIERISVVNNFDSGTHLFFLDFNN